MHLGLRAPNIWFRARLRYPDAAAPDGRVDVAGFTLPGLPSLVVGSNGQVAWGFTNSYGDWLDWAYRNRRATATAAPVIVDSRNTSALRAQDDTILPVRGNALGPDHASQRRRQRAGAALGRRTCPVR